MFGVWFYDFYDLVSELRGRKERDASVEKKKTPMAGSSVRSVFHDSGWMKNS